MNKPEDVSPDSLWHLAVENYYTKIVNVVYYLSRDPALAEDMAQEAFAIALEKFHQLRNPDKFLPWLTSIAINLTREHFKREKRSVLMPDMDSSIPTAAVHDPFSGMAEHIHAREFIQTAMLELSPQEYKAVILKYYLDFKDKDIAFAMGNSVGTVKKLLFRARAKLSREYQAWFEKDGEHS